MKDINQIIEILQFEYPDAKCSLNFSNPLELMIATILSAQCTDVQVNKVTDSLFKIFKTSKDYADVPIEVLEMHIKPTGFYKNKAKNIQKTCKVITEKFKGIVPNSMEELINLEGIGRKTANVILGNAYGIIGGIVVDTHVSRLSQRLGLTISSDPVKIESELMKKISKNKWFIFSHLLIFHGRKVCVSRKPLCMQCKISKYCSYFKNVSQ